MEELFKLYELMISNKSYYNNDVFKVIIDKIDFELLNKESKYLHVNTHSFKIKEVQKINIINFKDYLNNKINKNIKNKLYKELTDCLNEKYKNCLKELRVGYVNELLGINIEISDSCFVALVSPKIYCECKDFLSPLTNEEKSIIGLYALFKGYNKKNIQDIFWAESNENIFNVLGVHIDDGLPEKSEKLGFFVNFVSDCLIETQKNFKSITYDVSNFSKNIYFNDFIMDHFDLIEKDKLCLMFKKINYKKAFKTSLNNKRLCSLISLKSKEDWLSIINVDEVYDTIISIFKKNDIKTLVFIFNYFGKDLMNNLSDEKRLILYKKIIEKNNLSLFECVMSHQKESNSNFINEVVLEIKNNNKSWGDNDKNLIDKEIIVKKFLLNILEDKQEVKKIKI